VAVAAPNKIFWQFSIQQGGLGSGNPVTCIVAFPEVPPECLHGGQSLTKSTYPRKTSGSQEKKMLGGGRQLFGFPSFFRGKKKV
jgi:hypothetical protein